MNRAVRRLGLTLLALGSVWLAPSSRAALPGGLVPCGLFAELFRPAFRAANQRPPTPLHVSLPFAHVRRLQGRGFVIQTRLPQHPRNFVILRRGRIVAESTRNYPLFVLTRNGRPPVRFARLSESSGTLEVWDADGTNLLRDTKTLKGARNIEIIPDVAPDPTGPRVRAVVNGEPRTYRVGMDGFTPE